VDPTQGGCGGGSGPCIDQTVFGPTVANGYWSASTGAGHPNFAWLVSFDHGVVYADNFKSDVYFVRGVRSGL
jgi:hypothetical protein